MLYVPEHLYERHKSDQRWIGGNQLVKAIRGIRPDAQGCLQHESSVLLWFA